jgi:photosystem II stability/assembly factor-like uncharacterized protein
MTQVRVRVVENGESELTPEECRGIIVGPGVNQPDPFPGYGGFVGWETPARLRDGTWLVAFSAGYWHGSPPSPVRYPDDLMAKLREMGMPDVEAPTGGRAMITRSNDEGRTWSKPETIIDTPDDDRHPSLLELADGSLLCSMFLGGSNGTQTGWSSVRVLRSFDSGHTWEQEARAVPSPFANDETDGPLVLMPDGSVLMMTDGKRADGDVFEAGLYRTSDGGESFELISTLAADHDMYETTVARLPDGRLVMMGRPEGVIAWSEDEGRTWTDPVTFGMRLYAPALYVLQDGTLVCLHGSYGASNLRVIFSRDGGETWIAPAENHGFLVDRTYGYGKAMVLPDDSLFITHILSGGHSTHDAENNAVCCIKLRIRPDHSGIELLPAPNHE